MSPEQIVEMIKNNQTDPQWTIFRYNKTRAFLMLLYKIFFTGLLLGMSGILYFNVQKPLTSDFKLTIYGLGGVGLIGLLILLRHIQTMFYLSSNMIVMTPKEVIKSNRGTVQSWNYADISNLQQVRTQTKDTLPTYSIEFKDQKNGKVLELTRGYEFGSAEDVFEFLKTKIAS